MSIGLISTGRRIYTDPFYRCNTALPSFAFFEMRLARSARCGCADITPMPFSANRTPLRETAAEHGLGYVTRTENTHYKAGNLNSGLAELKASRVKLEFVAVLDADFIARPEFLRRTMALMKSGDIGIVQAPQCFYNPDPHQQAFGGVARWPDEQRGWFDVYLPSLDALDAATCCGTSCLVSGPACS